MPVPTQIIILVLPKYHTTENNITKQNISYRYDSGGPIVLYSRNGIISHKLPNGMGQDLGNK